MGERPYSGRRHVQDDPLAQPEEAIRRLYAYVAYRIGPGPDAEDVVSETIERALRYRSSYDSRKGGPSVWLAGIATRVLADALRQPNAAFFEDDESLSHHDDFASAAAGRLDLLEAVALLDDRSRTILALRYGAELKAREIAELLEVRTNTVEVALTRALARLRATLEGHGPPSERERRPAGSAFKPEA